jgi:elongation factor Ts
MSVTPAQAVKELRDLTGLGMMECKNLLKEAGNDLAKAKVLAVARGQKQAAKLAGRATSEGSIGVYVHSTKKIAGLVELNCNTDFVARGEDFQTLARDLAMHIAATDPAPLVVSRNDLSQSAVEEQKKIQKEALAVEGKPNDDAAVEKAMKGWYEESVLLEQPFVKDPSKTIKDMIEEKIGTIKENITIARFARWSVGETVKAPAASE